MEQLEASSVMRLLGVYGRFRAQLAAELTTPPLVLPNSQYFPDPFDGSPVAAQRLVERMQRHAGIADIPVRVVQGSTAAAAAKACSSGGCGPAASLSEPSEARLMLHDEGWLLRIEPAEAAHAVGLTTLVAQALGLVFLEETRPDQRGLPEPIALFQELSAVALGFGVLLLEGSHVYSKGCGGPSVARLTTLGPAELALLTCVFAADRKGALKSAKPLTSTTQRALLDEAEALVRGNPALLDWVRTARHDDADPSLTLGPPKRALFGGLFERRREPTPEFDGLEAALASELMTPKRALPRATSSKPVDDELKALVAEALQSET